MLRNIFYFVVFPGLLFSGIIGGLLSWFDRKITARVQFRKGPPLFQPYYDFIKLLYKETILPARGSRITFLIAPVFGLFGATMAAVFILLPLFGINTGFNGDVIVIFYLLTIPSVTYMITAMASGNPLAAIGASREMKLIIAYELSFLLVLVAVILKCGMKINMYDILAYQSAQGAIITNLSGVLMFIAAIFCVQAKLGIVPFDMSEAEAEITHGIFIEHSGSVYALVKLTKYIMLFILPAFVITLLLGGFKLEGIHILWSILKILGIVLLLTLIRNTNPRLKINQAMKFFLVWINVLLMIAIALAYYKL
jgi:NADH-quinone oxidoreductase subunit H